MMTGTTIARKKWARSATSSVLSLSISLALAGVYNTNNLLLFLFTLLRQ